MNFKTTVILIVLLAGVLVWLAVDHFTLKPAAPETPKQGLAELSRPLLDVKPADVTKVTLTAASGKRLVLDRAGGAWQLSEPVAAPADAFDADEFVRQLVDLNTRGQVGAGGNEGTVTGLDKPEYQVELDTTDGRTIHYAIGQRAAVGNAMYVQVAGHQQADVVNADVWPKLDNAADSLRDKRLVRVGSPQIQQVKIHYGTTDVALAKSPKGWHITSPISASADEADVSDVLYALAGLRATGFVNSDSAEARLAQLDRPQVTLWYSTAAAAGTTEPTTAAATTQPAPIEATITLSGYDTSLRENVFARVSGESQIAKVPATVLNSFRKSALDLRDRTIANIDPEKVTRIEIAADIPSTTQPTTQPAEHHRIVIERRKQAVELGPPVPARAPATQAASTGPSATQESAATQEAAATTKPASAMPASKWVLSSDGDVDAADPAVEALLASLHPLRAEKFLEHAPTTAAPSAQYTLTVASVGEPDLVLSVAAPHDPTQSPTAEAHGLAFEVEPTLAQQIKADYRAGASPAPPATPSLPPPDGLPGE